MDQHTTHAFLPNPIELSSAKPASGGRESRKYEDFGGSADIQSLVYQTMPLSQLPQEQATSFCKQLYSPKERFAQGFFRYWKEIFNMSDEEAWEATLEELEKSINRLTGDLSDPKVHTIGFNKQGKYLPIGLYAFRPLQDHYNGSKLIKSMTDSDVIERYSGKLAIAHSFSALNGYRNRVLMKYVFLLIALQALEEDFKHIFFFMSDYRLGPIYRRFGLEFPSDLTFSDSKHLVGCYSITASHMFDIKATAEQFGHLIPASLQLD